MTSWPARPPAAPPRPTPAPLQICASCRVWGDDKFMHRDARVGLIARCKSTDGSLRGMITLATAGCAAHQPYPEFAEPAPPPARRA